VKQRQKLCGVSTSTETECNRSPTQIPIGESLKQTLNSFIDEFDVVLGENAEELARHYIQQGRG